MNKEILEIVQLFKLGTPIEEIVPITGGITNSIYKLVLDKGIYAIKIINSSRLLQDKDLIEKIERSENIADKAKLNNINSITSIKLNNKHVNQYKDIYFIIYNWCEGKVLTSKEITLEQTKIIASSLAQLHNIKVTEELDIIKYKKIDYEYYYNLLKNNEEEWTIDFKNNIEYLKKIYNFVYDNYIKLSNQKSYVHKDLNRKNILWLNNEYNIIDWETATVSNPSVDFFNSAWFLTEDIKEDKFKIFTEEYLNNMNLEDDLEVAVNCSIIEECMWLEFSLKRALLDNNDLDEINLGKNSISSSLKEIINYYEKIPLMKKYLNI